MTREARTAFYPSGNWVVIGKKRFHRKGSSCVKVTPNHIGTSWLLRRESTARSHGMTPCRKCYS